MNGKEERKGSTRPRLWVVLNLKASNRGVRRWQSWLSNAVGLVWTAAHNLTAAAAISLLEGHA